MTTDYEALYRKRRADATEAETKATRARNRAFDVLRDARKAGMTVRDISTWTGLSTQRIGQILKMPDTRNPSSHRT